MRLLYFFIFLILFPLEFLGQGNDSIPDIKLGTVWFKGKSTRLTKKAKVVLDSLVKKIQNNPTMSVSAITYNKDFCDKCGGRSIKRAERVLMYIYKQGIDENRLTYTNRLDVDLHKVDLILTSLDFSPIVHPGNLRGTNK